MVRKIDHSVLGSPSVAPEKSHCQGVAKESTTSRSSFSVRWPRKKQACNIVTSGMNPATTSRSEGQTVFSVGTVRIAPIPRQANGLWMSHVARDLTDLMDGLYSERFVRTIKESCLDRLVLFGEASLRKAVLEFMGHYHIERNHLGLANRDRS